MHDEKAACETIDCKVYFVDDDRGVIHSSVQWLTLSGLKVQAFADPLQLLRKIRPQEACVIVSDIRMPELDGLSLMKHVHAKDRQIPVILITGHGDIQLAVEAMKAGAYEFLTKPFSPERLLQILREAMEKRVSALSVTPPSAPANIVNRAEKTRKPEAGIAEDAGPLSARVDDYERKLIESALAKHKGDIAAAIEELDLPRRTLNAKMTKYGINRRDFR